MTAAKTAAHCKAALIIFAGTALSATSAAWAQVGSQNLTIGFQPLGATVATPVPLSGWASAAIALVIALTALLVLRRRKGSGGRFLSLVLALAAGAAILGVAGTRLISNADAVAPVTILDLAVSPTLDVAQFFPSPSVTVVVQNSTAQPVRITSITLAPGAYSLSPPATCAVSTILATSATCTLTLAAS
jgi:hypothetical protein